ncbi:hypothetical protein ITJ86_12890 [Winogradskyella sp. F6397]|uniref:Uncharacterized protein n=1 Tax=Winogradskyella marina TaxID=2785530 RepID=A0ABS0EK07_9FLAO|nr:hypothetical protein [Winogradskyella marina]MBF8150801.1 hypothetical protein [Winogradskyella marina]
MNDTHIITVLIIIIICHIAAIIVTYKKKKSALIIPYLNMAIVIGILGFGTITIPNIKAHHFELIELIVIGFESCILLFAFFAIFDVFNKTYVKVVNFIGFGLHLLATIGLFYYMVAFKFDSLY